MARASSGRLATDLSILVEHLPSRSARLVVAPLNRYTSDRRMDDCRDGRGRTGGDNIIPREYNGMGAETGLEPPALSSKDWRPTGRAGTLEALVASDAMAESRWMRSSAIVRR